MQRALTGSNNLRLCSAPLSFSLSSRRGARSPLPSRRRMCVCVCRGGGATPVTPTSAQLQTKVALSAGRCSLSRNLAGATRRGFSLGHTAIQAPSYNGPPPPRSLKDCSTCFTCNLESVPRCIGLSCTWKERRGASGALKRKGAASCLPPGRRKWKVRGYLSFGFGGQGGDEGKGG